MDVSEPAPVSSKKILYVITKANWGGAQRYVYDLATSLAQDGNEVAVAYGTPGKLAERLLETGIRTLQVPGMGRDIDAGSDLRAYRELKQIFEDEQPDVVHLNSSKAGLVGVLAARAARVPRIIFTAHGWAFNEKRPWWQKFILGLVYGFIIYASTRTICVSHAVARDMWWLPGAWWKCVVIHNGSDMVTLKERAEARASLAPHAAEARVIGMLAELHPTKRIEDAIEAIALLLPSYPDLRLVVLGEGEERAALEFLIRERGLTGHVILTGFVADGPSYLSAFDMFVLCSRTEALGYAILEAGNANLPVVATHVGGIPEIITDGETGLLVPALKPAQLAEAIKSLLEDPAYAKQLGDALNERVRTEFSKKQMVSETVEIYSS